MKAIKWILIAAVIIILAVIIYLNSQAEDVPVTDPATGITTYPDGSYSYQTQYESGTIIQTTVSPDGSFSTSTISQGTLNNNPDIDLTILPVGDGENDSGIIYTGGKPKIQPQILPQTTGTEVARLD